MLKGLKGSSPPPPPYQPSSASSLALSLRRERTAAHLPVLAGRMPIASSPFCSLTMSTIPSPWRSSFGKSSSKRLSDSFSWPATVGSRKPPMPRSMVTQRQGTPKSGKAPAAGRATREPPRERLLPAVSVAAAPGTHGPMPLASVPVGEEHPLHRQQR